MYMTTRWLRPPCRLGDHPCGGYGQVGAGAGDLVRQRTPQVEKKRHVPMVLVQHGSEGKEQRGEESGSEKQGRWGTEGEHEKRESAPFLYSTLLRSSPTIRAAPEVHPPSRPASLARCAVRGLFRGRARCPLPPPTRGGRGWGGCSRLRKFLLSLVRGGGHGAASVASVSGGQRRPRQGAAT